MFTGDYTLWICFSKKKKKKSLHVLTITAPSVCSGCLTFCGFHPVRLLPILSPGAVFTGYYHSNPPGVYFSMPVLLSLLWALLKAGMVSDVFSVLGVSLAHKIVVSVVFIHLSTIMSYCSTPGYPVEGRECSDLFGERSTKWKVSNINHYGHKNKCWAPSFCLASLAMSSCWPSSTLWEKRVSWVLCLSSCSSRSRYLDSDAL